MVRKIRAKKRTLLVDGSILVYRIASAIEVATEWQHDMWTLHADAKTGKQILDSELQRYLKLLNCKDIVIVLDDEINFRKKLLPEYKSNRRKVRKPIILKPLKEYLKKKYDVRIFPTLEGDDTLGILATSEYKDDCIILSADKDMRTVPCFHHFMHDNHTELVDEPTANYHFMFQTLVGDATDNFKGCKTVGAVKAERVLYNTEKTLPSMWKAVVEEYKRNNQTPKEALLQARMARILRSTDYNFKSKKPILWQAPKI
tara:strand:- start:42 stop:815 length:774 start_codon:yes stop_codon:yes gene_type:complete